MKKRIVLTLWLLSVAGLLITGCSSDGSTKTTTGGNVESTTENVTDNQETKEKEASYESSALDLYDYFEEEGINGNIIDMVGNSTDNNYIVTKDNKIYENSLGEFTYILTANNNFKRVITRTVSTNLLIENKDNSYSIYAKSNVDRNFNFNAENLVLAYISMEGQLVVYTLEDNFLYLTWEESNGNKIIDHKPVYIDESSARLSSDEDYSYGEIKYAFPSYTSLAIIKNDGTTYYASIGVYKLDEKDAFALGTNSNYGLINDVDKIYADGDVGYYTHPFYSKELDTNHLYVRDTKMTSPTTYSISLPEGYSTTDIQEMHAIEEMILVMNDGNIYYKENAEENTSWELIEELSNLNKNSHIKSIVETGTEFLILCDDNYLYEFDY